MSTRRVKLVVAYDGTDFRGWAAQPGQRTVQSTLREAVRQVSGEDCEITGASRTDSGAHAREQTCHFDTEVALPAERYARALTTVLPSDLAVLRSSQVRRSFDARFSAVDRTYRYRILMGTRDPMRARYGYHYGRPLDLDAMRRVAGILEGEHDFRAFTADLDPNVENSVRRIFDVQVRQVRDEVWFEVCGTAFLRGMMRRMAGVALEAGRGYRTPEDAGRLLHGQPAEPPVVLPSCGLTLMRIRYGRHPRDVRNRDEDF